MKRWKMLKSEKVVVSLVVDKEDGDNIQAKLGVGACAGAGAGAGAGPGAGACAGAGPGPGHGPGPGPGPNYIDRGNNIFIMCDPNGKDHSRPMQKCRPPNS